MKPYSFYGLWTLREEPSIYKFLSHRGSNSITCQSSEGGTPGPQSGGGGRCCAVLVVIAVNLAMELALLLAVVVAQPLVNVLALPLDST